MMLKRIGLISALAIVPMIGMAETKLSQPIDCALGESCVIQQFMDADPSEKVVDFACGGASYNGHKGTDFRVSPNDMAAGVRVLAAADGVVVGMRNDMADRRVQSAADTAAIQDKECGNGVVLRHEDGLETQYCHMKQGSVGVANGQSVKRGQVLGQVGLSGKTQFPHLHLSVRQSGQPVDPFEPVNDNGVCGFQKDNSLWDAAFTTAFEYQPTLVVEAGVSNSALKIEQIVDGTVTPFVAQKTAPLVVFGLAVNGVKGDQLVLRLIGPAGEVVDNTRPELAKRKAQWMAFAGKKAPAGGWPAGTYVARVGILRAGVEIALREIRVEMP